MREAAFELRLCAHLERRDGVVARQLGASVGGGHRVMDVVRVTPGPEFGKRVALSADTIPPAAVAADASVAEWRAVTDAFDLSPSHARAVAERAAEAGFFETTVRDGTMQVRRAARYPDWAGSLVGVENKPDLGTPGDLATQLRKDVSLGLFDRVILATESYVTGAHLHRIPEAVGVWRVDFDAEDPIDVVREPSPLTPDTPGIQVVERHANRTEIRVAHAEAKARQRRRVAERAYGKGWRPAAFPDCARVAPTVEAETPLPDCDFEGRVVAPGADCGPDCPGHEAAPAPAYDPEAERERRTAWRADAGQAREQSGLDRFR
ncbi:MAG: DUF5787 family protein [Halobacteriaceae archaeon]